MNPECLYPKRWKEYIKRKQNGMDEMTLEQFLAKWQVSRQDLAILCECSIDTVNHWFSDGLSHREPNRHHRMRLAEADRELIRITHTSSSQSLQVNSNMPNRS
jgi:hypothetical protein